MNETMKTVNDLLVEVFNRILQIEEKQMKKSGVKISISELHLLENIQKSTTKTMSDVARLHQVTPGTLSVAVNVLIKKGYIHKCQSVIDKRIFILSLTEKAFHSLEVHKAFHDKMVLAVIRDLNLEAQREVVQGLQQISEYFRSYQIEDE